MRRLKLNSATETMIRWRTATRILFVPVVLLLFSTGDVARAKASERVDSAARTRFCSRPFSTDSLFRSEASKDLYNAALWIGGVAAIEFGATPATRWTRTNSFDEGIRSGLRADSESARKDSGTASDVMLGLAAGLVPLVSIGKTLSDRDCHEAYDMATDAAQAFGLTLLLTSGTKAISGRKRPYVEDCDGSPADDSRCGDSDRKQSFFSGHASMAATGAGLSCSYAIKRKTWGVRRADQITPCAIGIAAAVTTGVLRIVADKHWGSDVILGLTVGAAVGYFDTWGPFDLLRFEAESDYLNWHVQGMVLPYANDQEFGLRLGLTF